MLRDASHNGFVSFLRRESWIQKCVDVVKGLVGGLFLGRGASIKLLLVQTEERASHNE